MSVIAIAYRTPKSGSIVASKRVLEDARPIGSSRRTARKGELSDIVATMQVETADVRNTYRPMENDC
jgi:hypothetical protein